ncbi:MAG: YlxR family protein [Acidimicrobiaceae bacterium]|nr:YlxR family protein [Acidimicrobiaceae bacterium]MBO0747944.1 YlxR family protein [Acidimicrobiaceae bacterium]
MAGGGPIRTCVGCRQTRHTDGLVRVARRCDGTLVVDRTAPGRGAWVCRCETSGLPRSSCVLRAERSGSFARAFRASVAKGSAADLVASIEDRSPGGVPNMRG